MGDIPAYGPLQPANQDGLELPAGFTSRVVGRSGQHVAGTSFEWHPAPDGGACFPEQAGWIYVSNSEVMDVGGASAIKFASDGEIEGAYSILRGTNRNCAGGPTPWGTWLSCEEVADGRVFEADPSGNRSSVMHPSMGRFRHEAAAVDPDRQVVYLTEDEPDGCFYRFRPSTYPHLAEGTLEVLCRRGEGQALAWRTVPDPSARGTQTRKQISSAIHFDGGEGAWYGEGGCWFTTKGDNRVWRYDADEMELKVMLGEGALSSPLRHADNVTMSGSGEVFVAEDGPEMRICAIAAGVRVQTFLRVVGHQQSEVTGPAFSPDGSRLYFSSQRGEGGRDSDGVTYEVTGPFHA